MVDESYFENFCGRLLSQDPSIRFVGLADNAGHLVATAYREGLVPLMNHEETEKYTVQTVIRAGMRETFESKIGRIRYATGVYEKLIRTTVPIVFGRRHKFYVLLSFDLGSDVTSIIENKVLPYVERNREYFL